MFSRGLQHFSLLKWQKKYWKKYDIFGISTAEKGAIIDIQADQISFVHTHAVNLPMICHTNSILHLNLPKQTVEPSKTLKMTFRAKTANFLLHHAAYDDLREKGG